MDAAKYTPGIDKTPIDVNGKSIIDDQKVVRIRLANALRDLADEIESAHRDVIEVQTQEAACSKTITSLLFLRTVLKR